jgi:sugar phosphate isomerase/epimerase
MIKVGIHVDHLRMELRKGLQQAAIMGFSGVQVDAAKGPVSPSSLSESGRKHFRRLTTDLGLEICSLSGDFGGKRFTDSAAIEERVYQTKQILEFAKQLRIPMLTSALGQFSNDASDPRHHLARQAAEELANHADTVGVFLALEPADASPNALANLIREVDCPYLKVNYDPASAIIAGHDPVKSIEHVADQIMSAQLHDAVRSGDQGGRETRLGEGELPLLDYLAMMDEAGYRGRHILQRREGGNPAADLQAAKEILDRI